MTAVQLPLIGRYVNSHRNRLPAHVHFHTHLEQESSFWLMATKADNPFPIAQCGVA